MYMFPGNTIWGNVQMKTKGVSLIKSNTTVILNYNVGFMPSNKINTQDK